VEGRRITGRVRLPPRGPLTGRVRLTRQIQLRPCGSLARRAPLALALLASAAACRGSEAGPAFTARDSAGIRIAESRAPAWGQGQGWSVADKPELSIGVVEGDSSYQLYQVRAATRLSDGTIVVANGGTQQLRFYDASGKFVRSMGGSGDAPGEFRGLYQLARIGGDSLVTFDWRARRLSLFTPQGVHARDVNVAASQTGYLLLKGALGGSRFIMLRERTYSPQTAAGGYARDTLSFLELDDSARQVADFGRFPAGERHVEITRRGGVITSMAVRTIPFSREAEVAVGTGRVFIGSNDRYEIREFGATGKLLEILRRIDVTPSPVTDAMKAHAVYARLAALKQERPETSASEVATARKSLESLPAPPTAPTYGPILVDADGDLWVRDFAPPWATHAPSGWSVFDSGGRWLGTVTLPTRLQPYEVGRDYVLGRRTDDLGVEHVEMYALERGS
jgi:hypothetical protein